MEKIIKKINDFLKSNRKSIELKFKYGYFMKIKKNISVEKKGLDIHTSGYDGEMEVKEAIRNISSKEHTFYISGDAFSCNWDGNTFLWTAPSGSVYKMDAKEVIKSIYDGRYIKKICYDFN